MINKINDTIVSIATPKGMSGIGVVRISGINSFYIAVKIIKKKILINNFKYVSFFDKNNILIDIGLILVFKSPKSFTGENVIEFHVHGNNLILNILVETIIFFGARLALPGEFSFRAYFNNKIDLSQAEAINLLIHSNKLFNNKFILRSLNGEFSLKIKSLLKNILIIRSEIETSLNFPDDIFIKDSAFINKIKNIYKNYCNLFNEIKIIKKVNLKYNIIILGETNAGKSSLFNLLLNKNRALITDVPGTTRDFIEDTLILNNITLNLIDTAGFNFNTVCILEKNSILSTFNQIKRSNVVIFIFDITSNNFNNEYIFFNILKKHKTTVKFFVLKNKIDLFGLDSKILYYNNYIEIYISIKKKIGVDFFLYELNKIFNNINNFTYIVNERQYDLFNKININFKIINLLLENKLDSIILANNFESIYFYLSNIIGVNCSHDIVKTIFANFCIGK